VIDLHCHILPELDDGALDLADSVAMAHQAERDGITTVCATPHIRDDHDVRIDELHARVHDLQSELDKRGAAIRIVQGGEVSQLAVDGLAEPQLREVSLGRAGWILLEPAPGPIADTLPALAELLRERGMRTIVAHPERHAGIGFERYLRELAAGGCLIQWTAAFIAERDADDAEDPIMRLAREGLVHLLASDAHSSHGGRPVRLSAGIERLRAACPAEQVTWIVEDAPAAILRGEPVSPPS
jgi:protein-tyrosine phosphatase